MNKTKHGIQIIAGICMVLLLCACGKSYPTTEKILKDFEDEIFSEIGEIVSVEIVDEKETKDGVKQNVLVTVEEESVVAVYEYEVKYELKKGEWELDEYECVRVEYEPIEGPEEDFAEEDFQEIAEEYGIEDAQIEELICIDEECDLEDGEAVYVFQFTVINQYVISGEIEVIYVFDTEDGEWVVDNTEMTVEETQEQTSEEQEEGTEVYEENDNGATQDVESLLEEAVELAYTNYGGAFFTALYTDEYCITYQSTPEEETYIMTVYMYDEEGQEKISFEINFIDKESDGLINNQYIHCCEVADQLGFTCIQSEYDWLSEYAMVTLVDADGVFAMSLQDRLTELEGRGFTLINQGNTTESTTSDWQSMNTEELIEYAVQLSYNHYGYEAGTLLYNDQYCIKFLLGSSVEGYGQDIRFFDESGKEVLWFDIGFYETYDTEGWDSAYDTMDSLSQEFGWECLQYTSPNVPEYNCTIAYDMDLDYTEYLEDTLDYYESQGFTIIEIE